MFEQVDLLVSPTGPLPATPHGVEEVEVDGRPASVLGLAAGLTVKLGDGQVMQVTEQNPQLIREPGDREVGLAVAQDDITLLAR